MHAAKWAVPQWYVKTNGPVCVTTGHIFLSEPESLFSLWTVEVILCNVTRRLRSGAHLVHKTDPRGACGGRRTEQGVNSLLYLLHQSLQWYRRVIKTLKNQNNFAILYILKLLLLTETVEQLWAFEVNTDICWIPIWCELLQLFMSVSLSCINKNESDAQRQGGFEAAVSDKTNTEPLNWHTLSENIDAF